MAGVKNFVFDLALIGLWSLPASAAESPGQPWATVAEGGMGQRIGSVLLWAGDPGKMLLVGPAKGAAFLQAFDPAARTWSDFSMSALPVKDFHPYYQSAYDPGTKTIFCLSGTSRLYCCDLVEKTWKVLPPAAELEGLSWHTMACDPEGRRLVVVGADKRADNLGWSRTVVYDIPARRWSRLEVADAKVVEAHKQLVALKEATIDLVGRIRLAWFRDPKGAGTGAEIKALNARCQALGKMPQAEQFTAEVCAVGAMLGQKKTLDALKAARRCQRKIEEAAEAQYPVPCARRNSPLAYDAQSKKFVLFGGDHEDYLMNDTWVLDLEARSWKRMKPALAPSPRAGHALFPLPKAGGIALYEGYVQRSSTDYGAAPYWPSKPIELWRYDPKADRWDLLGHWPHPEKKDKDRLAPVGHFYGYAAQFYAPPAIAAEFQDRIVLAAQPPSMWFLPWRDFPARTWALEPDVKGDAEGRAQLGVAPNARLYRGGAFQAEYCEVADEPDDTGLDRLPENQWVRLPGPPRNPCRGCRQRDWGTAVWDSDRDQILLWGGGHCVRSASTVVHYSPASGRIAEGYDADEPYGANGGGGFDSSVLGRPWVSTHNYNHYAYDPKCRLMVSGRGYLYDPERMDWLREEQAATPFEFHWGSTVVETSPHGAVAWAKRKGAECAGLWLFDRAQGWIDLEPKGTLFLPYCDAHGAVYDGKRDRLIFSGVGGGYQKRSNGTFLTLDFKTRSISTLTPENANLARTRNAREMAYLDHADWVLIGDLAGHKDGKTVKLYTRVYDCGKNRMFLLDAGGFGDRDDDARWVSYSSGWMYDASRKLAYAFTIRGEAWALKVNPATARLVETSGAETGGTP